MLANTVFTKEDEEFIIESRRTIHRWPEGGFDLPRTLEFVKKNLNAFGVPYSEDYGISSIVGYINGALAAKDGKKPFTIAVRADMDALPVKEATGLEFA
ncbi:MAG: hypothetical protein IKR80_00050, partial [Spirochaetales bacterium]|nr:hypothetical protein [Spirochaetales bacterium]